MSVEPKPSARLDPITSNAVQRRASIHPRRHGHATGAWLGTLLLLASQVQLPPYHNASSSSATRPSVAEQAPMDIELPIFGLAFFDARSGFNQGGQRSLNQSCMPSNGQVGNRSSLVSFRFADAGAVTRSFACCSTAFDGVQRRSTQQCSRKTSPRIKGAPIV